MADEIKAAKHEAKEDGLADKKAELMELELKAKRLELLEREANLQDVQERLAQRELLREDRIQKFKTKGAVISQDKAADDQVSKRCKHRKGGNGEKGKYSGESPFYAVIAHTFANGDQWIHCQRCPKTWKPVKRDWFKTDAEYLAAQAEYEAAKNFPTNNTPSSAALFRFSDNGDHYREVTRDANLK